MRKTVILLLVVLFALTACSSTTGRTAGQNVDDTVIKSEINGKRMNPSSWTENNLRARNPGS